MKRFLLLPLFVLLLSAGMSFAEEGGGEHGMMMERHMCGHCGMEGNEMMEQGKMCPEKMMHHLMDCRLMNVEMYLENKEELAITSDQKDKLKAIKIGFEKAAVAKESDIKIAMIDLKVAAMKDTPDFSAVKQQVQLISKLYTDLFTAKIDAMEKGFNVLTDAQKQNVLVLKEEKKEKMKHEMKK